MNHRRWPAKKKPPTHFAGRSQTTPTFQQNVSAASFLLGAKGWRFAPPAALTLVRSSSCDPCASHFVFGRGADLASGGRLVARSLCRFCRKRKQAPSLFRGARPAASREPCPLCLDPFLETFAREGQTWCRVVGWWFAEWLSVRSQWVGGGQGISLSYCRCSGRRSACISQ